MKQMFWPCYNKFIKRSFIMQMLLGPKAQHTTVGQAILADIPGKGRETPLHSSVSPFQVYKMLLLACQIAQTGKAVDDTRFTGNLVHLGFVWDPSICNIVTSFLHHLHTINFELCLALSLVKAVSLFSHPRKHPSSDPYLSTCTSMYMLKFHYKQMYA